MDVDEGVSGVRARGNDDEVQGRKMISLHRPNSSSGGFMRGRLVYCMGPSGGACLVAFDVRVVTLAVDRIPLIYNQDANWAKPIGERLRF